MLTCNSHDTNGRHSVFIINQKFGEIFVWQTNSVEGAKEIAFTSMCGTEVWWTQNTI